MVSLPFSSLEVSQVQHCIHIKAGKQEIYKRYFVSWLLSCRILCSGLYHHVHAGLQCVVHKNLHKLVPYKRCKTVQFVEVTIYSFNILFYSFFNGACVWIFTCMEYSQYILCPPWFHLCNALESVLNADDLFYSPCNLLHESLWQLI